MDGTTLHLVCISNKLQHFLGALRNFHFRIFFFVFLLGLFRLTEIKPEQFFNHIVGIVQLGKLHAF